MRTYGEAAEEALVRAEAGHLHQPGLLQAEEGPLLLLVVGRRFLLLLPAAEAESEDDAVGDAGDSTEDEEVGSEEPEDESSMAMDRSSARPLASSCCRGVCVCVGGVGWQQGAAAWCREESDCARRRREWRGVVR